MQSWRVTLCLVLVLASGTALAQHQHGSAQTQSQYSDFKHREIKALSSTQIEDLLAGRGMGMSLPAELNNTPGPMHALEMGDDLGLTGDQKQKLQAVMGAMRVQAVKLGKEVVDAERRLDTMFASGRAIGALVESQAERIGTLNGKLRAVHLKAHMEATAVLTTTQVARYQQLRGY